MNESIKDLAIRAGLTVTTRGRIGPAGFGPIDDGYKKFAELIVKECQSRVEKYIRDCGEVSSLPDCVLESLLELNSNLKYPNAR